MERFIVVGVMPEIGGRLRSIVPTCNGTTFPENRLWKSSGDLGRGLTLRQQKRQQVAKLGFRQDFTNIARHQRNR